MANKLFELTFWKTFHHGNEGVPQLIGSARIDAIGAAIECPAMPVGAFWFDAKHAFKVTDKLALGVEDCLCCIGQSKRTNGVFIFSVRFLFVNIDFRQSGWTITRENRGEYLDVLCKKCKERIDKLGITRDNVGEISKYAADMYLGDRFDEVEAEFMSLRRRT